MQWAGVLVFWGNRVMGNIVWEKLALLFFGA